MTSRIILLAGAMACRGTGPADGDTDPPGNPDSETVDSDLDTVDTEVETDVDTVDTEVETDSDTVDTEAETDSDAVIDTDSDTVDTVVEPDSDTDSVTVDTETIDTDSVTIDTEPIDTDTVTIDTDVDTDSDLVDTDPGPLETDPADTDLADTDSQPADSDTAPGGTGLQLAEAPRACSLPTGTAPVFRPEMLDRFQLNPLGAFEASGLFWVPGAPSQSTVFGIRGTPSGLAAASFDLDVLWQDGLEPATTVLLNPAVPPGGFSYRSAQQTDVDPEVEIVAIDWQLGASGVSIVETPWTAPPVARAVVTTALDTHENSLAFGEHDLDGDGTPDLLYLHPGEQIFDPVVGRNTPTVPPWPIASVFRGPHTVARDQLAAETVLWSSAVARSAAVIGCGSRVEQYPTTAPRYSASQSNRSDRVTRWLTVGA